MSDRISISVRGLDALKAGVRERARVQVENDRLRGEAVLLEKQRRELWMLLDHIDTLDDACREHDDAFRKFARKHQKQRFEIWNPESDAEVLSAQRRVAAWVAEALGNDSAHDAAERALRTAEEAIELAQACDVPREALHRLVDYVFVRPVGDAMQEIGGTLLTLYSTAEALGVDADAAFEAELARIQRPEVMEKVRRRQSEKREALVGDLRVEEREEDAIENRRLADIVSKKRAGYKHVSFDTDLLTKYDCILKIWPANTLDIFVKRLTGRHVQHFITGRPPSATALFDALKGIHGDREEAEYEIKIVDVNTREFRGMGRIVMPDTRFTAANMRDIRKHKPLREERRDVLRTLLVRARRIWGDDHLTLNEIVVLLMVVVGDVARLARDDSFAASLTGMRMDDDAIVEIKRALGSVLFSTIRWIDDLGLDPLECLDLAIETDEKVVKSERSR